jgi:hypothetical protein
MAESPYDADSGRDGEASFAAQDSCDGDHVIGIGRVAHPEKESYRDYREKSDHGFEVIIFGMITERFAELDYFGHA